MVSSPAIWSRLDVIPGPSGLPVLGSLLDFQRDAFSFRTRVAREYGPVARYDFLGQPVILLSDPDDIEQVLVHENQKFVKGELFQERLGSFLGNGLLTSEGSFWRRQRHLIQPAFHPGKLEEYATVMTDQTEEAMAEWESGERRNVHEDMMAVTLEIVASALFGVDVQDRTDVVGDALDVIMAYSEGLEQVMVPEWIPTPGRREFEAAVADLDDVVYDIIESRKADPGEDVVSALLAAEADDGEAMSDRQIRDEAMTLLLAGHETTALALTYTFYLLGQHPGVEDHLVAELDSVLDGDPPTVSDLPALTYTEQVVEESMRLFPPVHAIIREPTQDVRIGGYDVPEGTPVTMSQWTVHRDPQFYEDPYSFRPSRWTDELEASLPAYAYFPFGGGPRRCIGERFAMMEARLVLTTILQEYHLELLTEPPLDLGAAITTRPRDPVEVRVHARDAVEVGRSATGTDARN